MRATQVLQAFQARLSNKFSPHEARYMMRSLKEDLLHADVLTEENLTNEQRQILDNAVERLLRDEPLQYVTGTAWFFKLKLHVNPSVLIPRPETEELVEWVLDAYPEEMNEIVNVFDIGTGSGCIAIAFKRMRSTWNVDACDISHAALDVAKQNAAANDTSVSFHQLDITHVPNDFSKRYHLIVSNPPYIAPEEADQLERNVKDFEPREALFTPPHQPQHFYKAIIAFSEKYLVPDGAVFVELHQRHAEETFALFAERFSYVEMRRDISGHYRMLQAARPKDFST